MAVKRILITVTTYHLPSRSYDELVCTDSVCSGNECTSSIDDEGMETSTGCPGEANCSEGFCERGDYGY